MERSNSSGSTSTNPSPLSSTDVSPESSPPPSPTHTGNFAGRSTREEEPRSYIQDGDDTSGILEQVSKKLAERKTTFGSWLKRGLGIKSNVSDPRLSQSLEPETGAPQRPVSGDAAELIKTDELKKIRQRNRERVTKDTDLTDPSSLASRVLHGVRGSSAELTSVEREIFQDELRAVMEEYVNDKQPSLSEISKRMVELIKQRSPLVQLAPNLVEHFAEKNNKELCSFDQLRSLSVPKELEQPVMMMAGIAEKVAEQLRTPLFDSLFSGDSVQQDAAYTRIQADIDATLNFLASQERLISVSDSNDPLKSCMTGDIQEMKGKLQEQQALLNTLRRQDFRQQKNYQSAAIISLEAFTELLREEKRAGNIEAPISDDISHFERQLQTTRDLASNQLRPNIIGDLINLEKELEATAHKYGISKAFKKAMIKARSEKGWEPIERVVPIRRGLETRLYTNKLTPIGRVLGYSGGVPSTGQHVTDKPCNGWVCEERSPEGRLTSRYVRSAVPDPYKAEGNERIVGGQRRAELELVAGLLMEYGGSADLLEQQFGTESQAFTPRILLESFLTTDQLRNKIAVGDNELQMNARAHHNFSSLGEDGSPHKIEFTDANGEDRVIYINQPKVALISCGSNGLALNPLYQPFTRSWATADSFTEDAVRQMLGEPTPGSELGGWVGDYLQDYQNRLGQSHPRTEQIKKLANEWRAIVQQKEHHKAEYDTFKLVNPADAIWELIRDPDTLTQGNVPSPDAMVPVVRIKFCKSGKDRTGAGCASSDRYRRELDTTGKVSVGEPGLTSDRQFNAQAGAVTSHLEVQLANGYMGYKTNGEARLLGKTVDRARKYKDQELG